jgi:hypothetical protein
MAANEPNSCSALIRVIKVKHHNAVVCKSVWHVRHKIMVMHLHRYVMY